MGNLSLIRKGLGLLVLLAILPFGPGCGGTEENGPAGEPNQGPGGPPGGPAEGKGEAKSPFGSPGKTETHPPAKGK